MSNYDGGSHGMKERWYAWFPVQLQNGEWAWLRWIFREPDIVGMKGNMYLGLDENEWMYTLE